MLGPLLLGSAEMWGPPEAPAEMLPPVLRPPNFACLIRVSGLATAPPQRAIFWVWQGPGEFTEFLDSVGSALQGFPCGPVTKDSACNAGDSGSTPGWERSPGEGNDNPFQYSCLENPMEKKPGRLQFMESQEPDTTWQLNQYQYQHLDLPTFKGPRKCL